MYVRDFTGERYGKLLVLGYAGKAPDGHSMWRCKCDCGNEKVLRSNNLQHSKSCGCVTSAPSPATMIGKTFGNLTVVGRVRNNKWNDAVWECICVCGRVSYRRTTELNRGISTDCGHHSKEKVHKKHGDASHKRQARLYRIYHDMIRRCEKPYRDDYERYGGRGISVCEEWRNSYEAFRSWSLENGYSEDLTIDRIDVNGNYSPENCKWSTCTEQANNKRNNHIVEYHGERYTLAELGRIVGVPGYVLGARIRLGWDIERAVSTPVKCCRRKHG